MSHDLVKSILKKGDHVLAYGDARTSELSGVVKSIGRVNTKIASRMRFSPTGPWFYQEHAVPLHAITMVVRGKETLLDLRKRKS